MVAEWVGDRERKPLPVLEGTERDMALDTLRQLDIEMSRALESMDSLRNGVNTLIGMIDRGEGVNPMKCADFCRGVIGTSMPVVGTLGNLASAITGIAVLLGALQQGHKPK